MPEKKLIVDQLKLTYEGLFDLNGLYRMIDSWFYEKQYDRWENRNYEQVLPTGKDIELELLPWKKTTTYFKNTIRIRLRCLNVKDVEIEKEGVKFNINQGTVRIIFDGYLETDYENWWGEKPMFYFIRTLFDKYIYKSHFKYYENWLLHDIRDLHARIQSFLNLYKYERQV
jgi:hypothetical protein